MDMAEPHGHNAEFDINIIMKYLLPKAKNLTTGQTVKEQDLTGVRYELNQRFLAEKAAERLAEGLSTRTKQPWVGFVEVYEPSVRRT
jgi:hypothetical protein